MAKSALITGSAKRIGREVALYLAAKNYNVAISYDKSEKEAKELQDIITKKYSVKCEIYRCDISKKENCLTLMKDVLVDFKDLSLLINNASIFNKSDAIEDFNDEYEVNMAVHVTAPLILSQEFAKNVAKNDVKNANIINMIDKNITRDSTQFFYYLLSKKTLDNLTRMLAASFAPKIRVNGIAPGYILDDHLIATNPELGEKIIKQIPLKKKGDVKNIVTTVDFIINNDYLTGQTLFVDGGASLNTRY